MNPKIMKMKKQIVDEFLKIDINEFLDLFQEEIQLPTIPGPTMGGEVFWNTLAENNGYKLQQNMFTRHARILDKDDNRLACGTVDGMKRAMDRFLNMNDNIIADSDANHNDAVEALKDLKELYDKGIISEDEYQKLRKKYLAAL